ncbi:MAG: hypothetical protein NZV14_19565 [Bryobacteraceae bacterium]|nr:hypothetical protein [Bryobacteraceae bacterium]MDW8380363.1 hypothetical protein [Bryobacterales bacterium]
MGLDLRLPIGLIFVVYGILLAAFGLLSDASLYRRSLGVNINLIWGCVLLVIGLFFLYSARREKAR